VTRHGRPGRPVTAWRRLWVVMSAVGLVAAAVTLLPEASSSARAGATTPAVTAAPAVTALSPGSGPSVSGATVTITGTGFTGTTGVNFGSAPATAFSVDSDTTITATSPAQTTTEAATVDVTVTNPSGTSPTSSADQFTYISHWSQGTVTTLPATASTITVTAATAAAADGNPPGSLLEPGQPYAGLQVSVNQTQNLTDQAISVSWTGGVQTSTNANGAYLANYLQMFECWSNPSDPAGPSPSQCEFGGESSSASNYPIDQNDSGSSHEYSRVLAQAGWGNDDSPASCGDSTGVQPCTDTSGNSPTNFVVQPFQAADGTVVKQQANYNYDANPNAPANFWLEPYFSFATTDEVDFARTLPPGVGQTTPSGQQLFDVDTGLNAPGLGCGQTVKAASGSGSVTPKCWLVVVPRGNLTEENPSGVTGVSSVVTSPLTASAWANRVTIPLAFNPVGSSCSINANATEIEGSELASPAVSSWEPQLCNLPGAQPYSYLTNDDDQARQNLTNPSYGAVGMSVFTDPIPAGATGTDNPVVYAPLTLSGAVVAFNIQRVPIVEPDGESQPDEAALADSRIQNIYLTPRLVAKLLTQSYQAELRGINYHADGYKPPAKYDWVLNNPVSIFDDPDFLQYNPEFELLSTSQQIDATNMVVEEGSSDAATTLWKWVLADPAARAWLDGTPTPDGKPGGMQVNPYYSLNPAINPAHESFAAATPESFPKDDPWCDPIPFQMDTVDPTTGQQELARQTCIQDWSPYVLNMAAAAGAAATANDQAKTTFNPTLTPDTAWTSNGPQISGNDLIISLTDAASAARYGLQTASLSPAGDDTDPTFVNPTPASFLAAEQNMAPSSVPDVLQTDSSSTAPNAYPLTMLSYAAATPEKLTSAQRQSYAAFLDYAAGAGQHQGVDPGDLPAGYEPLPESLTAQTLAAAQSILHPPVYPSTTAAQSSAKTATKSTSSATSATSSSGTSSSGTAQSSTSVGSSSRTSRHERGRALGPAALSAVRVEGLPVGALRWILPLLLLFGVLAALGAAVLKITGRRSAAAAGEVTAVEPSADGSGDPS
jgi:hypothetical protein